MQSGWQWKRWISGFCMISLMALIFFFSSQPREASNQVSTGFLTRILEFFTCFLPLDSAQKAELVLQLNHAVRKCAHFSIYTALGMATMVFVSTYPKKRLLSWGITLAICLLYAAGDELHQAFVPGRGPQVRDVCIDFGGALLGSSLVCLVSIGRERRKSRKTKEIETKEVAADASEYNNR